MQGQMESEDTLASLEVMSAEREGMRWRIVVRLVVWGMVKPMGPRYVVDVKEQELMFPNYPMLWRYWKVWAKVVCEALGCSNVETLLPSDLHFPNVLTLKDQSEAAMEKALRQKTRLGKYLTGEKR